MKLAAGLVHYRHPEQTAALVQQLQRIDIIDPIVVVLHSEYPLRGASSRTIYLPKENRGYAAGLNLAARYVEQNHPQITVMLAMNCDVQLEEAQLQQLLQSHFQAGADCTFPVIEEGKELIHGYRFNRWGTMQRVTDNPRFFPGTCFLFNLSAWKKAGGFNEEYFHYYEDADFCLRLYQAGCKIYHEPAVVVKHQGKSAEDYPAGDLPRYAVRNHLRFLVQLGQMNAISFANVSLRHLLYLFRWKHGWRGIGQWFRGIQDFRKVR